MNMNPPKKATTTTTTNGNCIEIEKWKSLTHINKSNNNNSNNNNNIMTEHKHTHGSRSNALWMSNCDESISRTDKYSRLCHTFKCTHIHIRAHGACNEPISREIRKTTTETHLFFIPIVIKIKINRLTELVNNLFAIFCLSRCCGFLFCFTRIFIGDFKHTPIHLWRSRL